MIGIDADYAMSRTYRSQGWPSFVVVDQEGMIRFHGPPKDRDLTDVRKCIDHLLSKTPGASARKPVLDRGIAYLAEVLASRQGRRDRSPRLAFDRSGNPCVVYYSNREGTNSVFLRRYNPKGEMQEERRLSAPKVESYAADCTFDANGTLWVTWCGREKGLYDIFVQSLPAGREPVTEHFTSNYDDAMSPRIAAGPGGTVTVVYYQWRALRGVSRDRDVFARTYDPARRLWQPALEVSPHEPEVEDHTDPDVVVDRQGRAWVAWSYDYHPSLFKQPVDASQPTIFAALAKSSNAVSTPFLVGATGASRNAIDLFPSAAMDEQGTLWCAWDSSDPRRCIRMARFDSPANQFQPATTFGKADEICSTPEMSSAGTNGLLLAWSQRTQGGRWQGKCVRLNNGKPLAEIVLAEPVDILFPQAQQAPNGEDWITYERSSASGSEVVLRNISPELRRAGQTSATR